MSELQLKFEHGGLEIVLSRSGNVGTMAWRGSSDSRSPGEFLESVFRRAIEHAPRCELVIDFTALEFMNSSTVSPIIAFLKDANLKRIQCRVVFSDAEWQRPHMRCLRAITSVLPHISVDCCPARTYSESCPRIPTGQRQICGS